MSAPKTPEECIVRPVRLDDAEFGTLINEARTVEQIAAYAAEEVREATEALSNENADLRSMLAKASLEEWLKHRAAMARDAEVAAICAERDAARKENADLRARVEAIRKAWEKTGGFFEANFETLLDRALDLTRPFKEGA